MIKRVPLKPIKQDTIIRAGDFGLMPTNPSLPIINSQPFKNVVQTTWVNSINSNGTINYKQPFAVYGTYTVVKGTQIEWLLRAVDPSNVNNVYDDANLKYTWKKDGADIYQLNALNDGKGIRGMVIPSASCTPEASGRYTCEVSNLYGSIESDPVDLVVVDLDEYPYFYRNLIKNGNADGGMNNWDGDSDVLVKQFINNSVSANKNFGSFPEWSYYDFNKQRIDQIDNDFHFSSTGHETLMFPFLSDIDKAYKERNDTTLYDLNAPTKIKEYLPQWRWWNVLNFSPNIVTNEDYETGRFAGFFPGMNYIDKYNRNDRPNLTGLFKESENAVMYYFTRDRIKFDKDDGKVEVKMSQIVDVSAAADFINGNVFGVDYVAANFFAYVGIGITRYMIKATTESEIMYNWYIADTEQIYNKIQSESEGARVGGGAIKSPTKYLEPGTPIEIIPVADDLVDIDLDFLDANENIIDKKTIKGPDIVDIFAVKEKSLLPMSLYPIVEYFVANGNPITIFGQRLTDTDAIKPLFNSGWNNGINKSPSQLPADRNAAFFLKKMQWGDHQLKPNGYYTKASGRYKSMSDKGASAMIAVGSTEVLPKRTYSVRVTVRYRHTSDIPADTSPQLKGWNDQEIYSNLYGQSTGNSLRPIPYGNPRCGVTKMKMLLLPNGEKTVDKYVSYFMPPANKTVLGLYREALSAGTLDTSQPGRFVYQYYQPELRLEDLRVFKDPLLVEKERIEMMIAQQQGAQSADAISVDTPLTEEELVSISNYALDPLTVLENQPDGTTEENVPDDSLPDGQVPTDPIYQDNTVMSDDQITDILDNAGNMQGNPPPSDNQSGNEPTGSGG